MDRRCETMTTRLNRALLFIDQCKAATRRNHRKGDVDFTKPRRLSMSDVKLRITIAVVVDAKTRAAANANEIDAMREAKEKVEIFAHRETTGHRTLTGPTLV
ncbi:hypothetical protein M513_01562 [Trichuris suis]|uniref:Uncharacterized protein n=1 Tax=Trichuris suis TaxID=68888 RepID=A0A085MJR3_9BILA|nr:hypothetical protein M513_01562 [Trichuris suis]